MSILNKIFQLERNKTSIKQELYAGIITFLTMLYIIFVNPIMLSVAGMDISQVFIATCLAIFASAILSGLFTNLPLVLAPGMGLNAIFVYDVVKTYNYSYETALLTVFICGIATFIIFALLPAKIVLKSLPKNLRIGITSGAGAFLVVIGLKLSNIIMPNSLTLGKIGDLSSIKSIFTIVLSLLMIIAYNKKLYFISALVFIVAVVINSINLLYHGNHDLLSSGHSSYHQFHLFINFFHNFHWPLISVIITLFFASNFDAIGSFTAYTQVIKKDDKTNERGLKKIMMVKGMSSIFASIFGTSSMTIFLESNTGIMSGGRTGLVTIFVGIFFLLALLLKPLLLLIPAWSSSPVIVGIGLLMMTNIKNLNWDDYTEYTPALLILIFMPLTYSISSGIAIGLIVYVLIKLFSFRYKEVNITSWILAIFFAIYLLIYAI